ncbi:MAG TPA: PQQ-binding-like beta-propeller repeat protein, partial [Acidimicrobiia bacterium]|nr:PQQ-binding-like beta-propeller repeat protein [Acidimicrobiia bacterium]
RQGLTIIGAGDYAFALVTDTGAIFKRSAKFGGQITTSVIGGWKPVSGGVGDYVWFGTGTGHVKALDDATMGELWSYADTSGFQIADIAHEDNGGTHLFAGEAGGNMHGLDDTTGTKNWDAKNGTATPNCACGFGAIMALGSEAYMVQSDGHVRSYRASDGTADLATSGTPGPTMITEANGVILGSLYGSNAIKTFNAGNLAVISTPSLSFSMGQYAEPVPADGALWLVGIDGYLHKVA